VSITLKKFYNIDTRKPKLSEEDMKIAQLLEAASGMGQPLCDEPRNESKVNY